MSELVFFDKEKFQGKHHHIFDKNKDLSITFGTSLPSSMVIKSGEWALFTEKDFKEESKLPKTYGPGMYDFKIEDIKTSVLSVRKIAEVLPTESISEVILFGQEYFRGITHHHVFGMKRGDGDPNLGVTGLDNITSSIIVTSGIWGFFDGTDFEWTEFNRLGPGMYAAIQGFNFPLHPETKAEQISSVMLYKSTEKLNLDEVILFSDLNMQGKHHHIYCNDPNLEVSKMQNVTSSIVVIKGNWKFFGAPNFEGAEYWEDQTLGLGVYPDVTEYNIRDNVITSVRIGIDEPLVIAEPKPA